MLTRIRIGFTPNSASSQRTWLLLLKVTIAALVLIGAIHWTHRSIAGSAAQTEGAVVTGVVQDDKGAPVVDAKVTLHSAEAPLSVRTQPDGRYEFRNLKPGQYRITADATSFRKQSITITITRPDEAVTAPILRLVASSLHVAVLDGNNQPLGRVSVGLSTQERGSGGATSVARTTTDEGGDAYFGKLAPGSYQLTAVLRGYDEYHYEVFISSGITTELAVQLSVAPVIAVNEKAVVRYSVPNLPSKNVQAVFQDSEGWVWFGTDRGIARFNGADFESSSVSGSPYEQLAGEDVRSITEDSGGVMWFATPRGARRITKAGGFVDGGVDGKASRQVYSDSTGRVWVSTADGLIKFDGSATVQLDQSTGLPSSDVRAVAEDKSGKIWVATARGLAIIDGGKVSTFDQQTQTPDAAQVQPDRRESRVPPPRGSTAAAPPTPPDAPLPAEHDVRCILVDTRGALWFAGSAGVYVLNGKKLSRVRSSALDNAGESGVRAIGQDRRGRIWFALGAGGALLYDADRSQWQRVGSLERNKVAAVFNGSEGITWFATDNGAVRADLYSFVAFNASRGLVDNDVRQVVEIPATGDEQDRGKLWFVTGAGISFMEEERFVPVGRFRANTSIRAIAFDRDGSYWLATEHGALKLSGQTITQLGEGNGLAANNVHFVTVLSDGSTVVFATSKGANIFRQGQMKSLDALSGYDVRHVFEDVDGKLWFATARGVVGVDPATHASEVIDSSRGLADNDTRSIIRFKDQLLIATRAGVQVKRGGSGFTTFDGEPASTLFVDRDGFLWVGTDDGQVKKFAIIGGYNISSVYSGEIYALTGTRVNSVSEDGTGQIWIGTDKGAVRHLPVRLVPPPHISLKADSETDVGEVAGSHTLPYGRQRLTFYFSAASMTGQVRYLYRINAEQANEPWSLLPVQPGATREVTLFGIDSGTHAFEVIALNRDLYGAGSEFGEAALSPAASLVLRVEPPFWSRWWFYMTGLAAIALTVGSIMAARKLRDREYVLPKELRTFTPIEPNPYIVGNPLRTESMFFGREDDFRYVRTKLEGVNQGVVIVFCGERRVGKSSILYQVLNGRLGERFVPVFVDMQEMVIASDTEFFARISRLIAEAVSAHSPLVTSGPEAHAESVNMNLAGVRVATAQRTGPLISVPQFDGRNPYPIFLDFLDETLAALADRTLLILIDEYELMEAKVDEGKLSPDLFTFLAGLMDNKERLALIFTGSRRLEERDKKYWRELLRRSLFRKVGFLSEKDAARLITEPVAGRAVYGRGVVDVVSRLTAGQPFYAQVTCQNIVDYMNEHKQNWVTLADLQHVIADIVDNPLPQMIYTWDGLSDDEKLVLSLLGEQLPDGSLFATARELRTSVRSNDYPVNLSENTIRLTLEEMFRRELLEKNAADGFRIKIDLLRLWIRRSHSIWQVVKEVRTL